MMFGGKTALGIDISDSRINLALLKSGKGGLRLLKAAGGPLPEGTIENGNIENPAALAKAIKELKAKNKISARRAAISLVANPVLMQILDLPKDIPSNIRQFVRDEVKHYAMLPINQTAIDFCIMKSLNKGGGRRAFVVATDSRKIAGYAKMFNGTGLNIDACEPAVVAYIRACYAKKIAPKFDHNLLFAIVRQGILTLCVFRNQALDFVRTKLIETDVLKSDRYFEWLKDEILSVIKFYEVEVLDKHSPWDVTFVADTCDDSVKKKMRLLWADVEGAQLEIRTFAAETGGAYKPSVVAVGLAMKLLSTPQQSGLNINILPQGATEARSIRKDTLVTANTIAAILVLMILGVALFNIKAGKINEGLAAKKQTGLCRNIQTLLSEKASLDKQIVRVTSNLKIMDSVLGTKIFLRWGKFLDNVAIVVPKKVQITSLASSDNSKMLLEGRAVSYDDVNLFVEMLNECKYIKSASLVETRRDELSTNMVRYSISCLLSQ